MKMEQETKDQTVIDTNIDTNSETKVETDTETKVDSQVKDETGVEDKVETKEETKKDIMIPKERFDEVNGKYKELSAQVKAMEEAKEAMEAQLAEMKQASEQTNTSISETTEKLEGQVKQYETLLNEMVSTKLQAIPEDMQELIPEGLSTEQKLSWINKAESKGLFGKKAQQVEIGKPLNHSSEQDKAERMKKMNPLQLLASYYGDSK
jgi:uncharacterized coiled-coil DUF342 family protein